jgi:hypothetical protein
MEVLCKHNYSFFCLDTKETPPDCLPRGLSFGGKYELTRDTLKEIMNVTNIDNFATLDLCIWSINDS